MSEGNGQPPPLAIMGPPVRNNASEEPNMRQPRQPHNLQGLLRFAMEATRAEDAPGNSDFGPMDEERRKFLEEALRSLTVDVARVLQESTRVLSDAEKVNAVGTTDDLPEEIATAFNNLMDFVDDVDIANDFYKIGGFAVFPVLLAAHSDEMRARACQLLAVLCQNNPYTQSRALETGLLNILINMAENENDHNVVAMTTYALGCCMREFEPSCKEFIAQNGCQILLRLLNFDSIPVRTKAAFLTRYFCKHFPEAKAQLLENKIVSALARLISGERNMASEHILSILIALCENEDAEGLRQIRNPEIRLKEILTSYVTDNALNEDTDYIEEKEYCEELLKIVDNVKPCGDSVER